MNPADSAPLKRLWPHREHESNWLKSLFCAIGFHRWHRVQVALEERKLDYDYCRWCADVRPPVIREQS